MNIRRQIDYNIKSALRSLDFLAKEDDKKKGFFTAYEKVVSVIGTSFAYEHFQVCERLAENFARLYPNQTARISSLYTILHHKRIAVNKEFEAMKS